VQALIFDIYCFVKMNHVLRIEICNSNAIWQKPIRICLVHLTDIVKAAKVQFMVEVVRSGFMPVVGNLADLADIARFRRTLEGFGRCRIIQA